MSHVKNIVNGAMGFAASLATVGSQLSALEAQIKILAGLGGLVVIAITIYNGWRTAQKTNLEIAKLKAENASLQQSTSNPSGPE